MKNSKKSEPVVVYVATYASPDDAKADYAAVKRLHHEGLIGLYDAAVVTGTGYRRVGADGRARGVARRHSRVIG